MKTEKKGSTKLQEVMKITKQNMEAAKEIEACQKQNCSKELTAMQVTRKLQLEKIKDIITQLQNNKISGKEYIEKLTKFRESVFDDPDFKALAECSLEHCKERVMKLLGKMILMTEYDCKEDKQNAACAKYKRLNTIISKNPMKLSHYIKFLKLIAVAPKK